MPLGNVTHITDLERARARAPGSRRRNDPGGSQRLVGGRLRRSASATSPSIRPGWRNVPHCRAPSPIASLMVDAFQRAVATATRAEQAALIAAHPDLAGRAALAPDSAREQQGAGLDSLTRGRARALHRPQRSLSRALWLSLHPGGQGRRQGRHPRRLRDADRRRPRSEEFWTALSQVMRIIRFRLEDRVDG